MIKAERRLSIISVKLGVDLVFDFMAARCHDSFHNHQTAERKPQLPTAKYAYMIIHPFYCEGMLQVLKVPSSPEGSAAGWEQGREGVRRRRLDL